MLRCISGFLRRGQCSIDVFKRIGDEKGMYLCLQRKLIFGNDTVQYKLVFFKTVLINKTNTFSNS